MSLYVIALDDHADGNAYAAGIAEASCMYDAISASLLALNNHDHVGLITSNTIEHFDKPLSKTTANDIAPYGLLLSAGKFFPIGEIVNKL